MPVSSVSKRQFLDSDFDLELDPQKFPLLGLTKICYLRTHKQTIVNQNALTTEICDLKSVYPDLYLQAMILVEKFEKMIIDSAF